MAERLNIFEAFGYLILKIFTTILGILPLRIHYILSSFVAFLVEKVFKYRKDDVLINIARCFPEMSYGEVRQTSHKFYRHFADVFAEAIWFGFWHGPRRVRRSHIVEMANPEVVAKYFTQGKSVMVLCSHCGNWELQGGICCYNYTDVRTDIEEKKVCVSYRKIKSKVWDRFFMKNRLAALEDPKHYPGYVESRNLVRFIYKHAEEQMLYNIITDQRPYFYSKERHMVHFFYDEVETMDAGAALACKLGMPVLFLSMPIVSRGHYKWKYSTICEDASKSNVEDIMKEYYRLLEEEIRHQPENYLWTHHRWWKN